MKNKSNKPKSTFSEKTRKTLSKLPKFNKEKFDIGLNLTEFECNGKKIKL